MLKHKIKTLLIVLIFTAPFFSQNIDKHILGDIPQDSVYFIQLQTDSLFNSRQIISILAFGKQFSDNFQIVFAYSNSELKTTSSFAQSKNAYAAINAGFFDMTKGGSVSYFEINDTVISYTHSSESRWAKPTSIINGAIVITKNNDVIIQTAEKDSFYAESKNESAVLLTGPLLLSNSHKVKLIESDFAKKRHPRTFFCTTENYIVMIAVDGRSKDADGMNLFEAQDFLLSIGCVNAINLDGGGSTTMWLKDKGIVNFPSDKTGERPVANAILLIRKTDR